MRAMLICGIRVGAVEELRVIGVGREFSGTETLSSRAVHGPFSAQAVLGPPLTAGYGNTKCHIPSPIHGASRCFGLSHSSEKPCEQGWVNIAFASKPAVNGGPITPEGP